VATLRSVSTASVPASAWESHPDHSGVVSERLGHANIAFTMQTYQHLLPGMQADAARTVECLSKPAPPPGERHRGTPEEHTE